MHRDQLDARDQRAAVVAGDFMGDPIAELLRQHLAEEDSAAGDNVSLGSRAETAGVS